MRRLVALAAVGLTFGADAAGAVTCEAREFDGTRYTLCTVDAAQEDLRTFLYDSDGTPWGQFATLDAALRETGEQLAFAMNAGMYHADRAPVGYYVEQGNEVMGVVSNPGPGNFGLLPNGLLCIREGRADVIETRDFIRDRPDCAFATQSGPMLVIDGELHPRFLADSDSRYVRNGVGTSADGTTAVFAISESAVNFHEFARLFRDGLGLPDALFFDGNVSRVHAPGINRSDFGRDLGPMVGVVEPAG
ncbi:phosphodiester glycosidase family protein [Salipiger mucosus]|uniref:Phosphodiester glycosidase domain-containing protein n=1 Tax=Salipiger mucosus DSM 16094 TaxID=1123237 RepID=S9QIS4_9RHOB|nr:phosphodiester glycosidase family protein [Salipiger mucosus]EPX79702.1 hypothetical protein Salmuc_05645 [Salipiger mucosus DSM 16094]